MTRHRKIKLFLAVYGLLTVFGLSAAFGENNTVPAISLKEFKKIPILEEGRIKPMETYAQTVLLQFSGRRSYQRLPAVDWLGKLLFAPESVREDKIFLVNNPEVALALGIVPDHKRRYSFAQLEPGFPKLSMLAMQADQTEEKKRSVVENELLRLYGNVHLYLDLMASFQFAAPTDDFLVTNPQTRQLLKLSDDQNKLSFIDLALKAEDLHVVADSLKGKSQSTWNDFENDVFRLLSQMYQQSTYFGGVGLHIVIPTDPKQAEWITTWNAFQTEFQNVSVRQELGFLADMAKNYATGNQGAFDQAVKSYRQSILSRSRQVRAIKYLPLELLYNRIQPFGFSQMFYFLALVLTFWSLFSARTSVYRLAFAAVILGFIPHVFGFVARIVILNRPPVSNLYETFIFVAFLSVLSGIIVEFINKQRLGLLVSGVCGTILLLIAGKFSAEGDTMKMLVAVLNSNFWLTIHVLHITAGYATCCVAGVLAHVYLIQAIVKPRDRGLHERTFRYVFIVLGLGLTLTVFGTAMGGVWADQSWGRFWGWDPKENGALLIILWCSIIFHLRVAKLIGALGFAIGSALVIPVVMWAWFGVNLLSVGLHSYGFTQGIATNLITYYTLEMAFVLGAILFIRWRNPQLNA